MVATTTAETPEDETGDTPLTSPASGAAFLMHQLLGMVSQPPSVISLQEKQLAQDLLAVLLSEAEQAGDGHDAEVCARVVERLCHMRPPPMPLLRAVLDCADAAGRERLGEELHAGDEVLLELLHHADAALLAGLLRRRHIPAVVVEQLLEAAPDELLGLLLDNEGAVLGEASWRQLLPRAAHNRKIAAHMMNRADLPRHVALELFWHLSNRQRRLYLLRNAGNSQQLQNLLDLAMPQAAAAATGREFLAQFHVMLGLLAEGDRHGAVAQLAQHCGLDARTVRRILRDPGGEPLGVLLKAFGTGSGSLREIIKAMRNHRKAHLWPWLEKPEQVQEVHSLLAVNNARVMVLYWDWRSRAMGPYRDFPPLGE